MAANRARSTRGNWILTLLTAATIAGGCGDESTESQTEDIVAVSTATASPPHPPTTPSTAPSPTQTLAAPTRTARTPIPTSTDAEAFRAFADEIDAAVRARDVEFFMGRLRSSQVVCGEDDIDPSPGGPSDCQAVGQEYSGVSVGFYGSEGAVIPIHRVEARISELLTESLDNAADAFGTGVPQLYALELGVSSDRFGVSHLGAVMTALNQRPDNFAGSGPFRRIVITFWTNNTGEWQITRVVFGFSAEQMLDPPPDSGYYSNFVRYPS